MPVLELKELVEEELQTNPLLEEDFQPVGSPLKINLKAEDNDYRRDLRLTKPLSLQENLLRQLRILATSQEEIDIGEEIIGNIDDDGYLKTSLEEIAHSVNQELLKVEAIAAVVQSFDPLCVAARDLKECLLIQLQAKGEKNTLEWRIVENCLDACAKKQYAKIAKMLEVSIDEVKMALGKISRLEPKPGRKYSIHNESQYIVPDVYIKKVDDEYQIVTNQLDVPNVKINLLYRDILKDKNSDQKTEMYIKERLRSANFLIKCIKQRQETMRRITEFLVKEQSESLEKGRTFIRPLTFKSAADAIGRHESTISRAIANKYIDTPSGIFALREFFNGKVTKRIAEPPLEEASQNNNDHSAISVKMALKGIIDGEGKRKPLSDKKLQKILDDKGIKISRRTIAKYREELKILPSHLRKR